MSNQSRSLQLKVISGIVIVGVVSRLLPHPPNFTALTAVALFGGAYFQRKALAWAVPMIAMLITDAIIGFHSTMWAVYLSFAVIAGMGTRLSGKVSVMRTGGAALLASVLFFAITNFAVWLSYPMYSKDLGGLLMCYEMAIPFFQYQVWGDLMYTAVIFGGYAWAQRQFPLLARA